MNLKMNRRHAGARWPVPRALALGVTLCLAWLPANAEELQALLRMTRDHPSVAGEEAAANAAAYDVDVAKAGGKLQVGVGLGSVAYSSQTGNKNEALKPYVAASKLLYDHGRTQAEVEGREAAHEARQARTVLLRENIGKQVTSLYATALAHRLAGQILDEQVASLKNLLNRVASIVQVDPGRASEANQVESRLASALSNREARLVGEREAWQQLTQLLQRDVTLDHDLPDLKQLQLLPTTMLQADRMLEDHPALTEARRTRDESDAAYRVATKWNRPRWTLDLRADSMRNPENGQMQWFEGVAVELRGNLSLLDGGAGAASAQGESQRLQSAEAGVERVRRELKQELHREWVALPLREHQLDTMDELVDAADRIRKAGEEQFFAGRRPLTDLMGFDSEYFLARISREEQRVQYLTSQWMILAALGRLSDTADTSRPIPSNAIGESDPAPERPRGSHGRMAAPARTVRPANDAIPARTATAAVPESINPVGAVPARPMIPALATRTGTVGRVQPVVAAVGQTGPSLTEAAAASERARKPSTDKAAPANGRYAGANTNDLHDWPAIASHAKAAASVGAPARAASSSVRAYKPIARTGDDVRAPGTDLHAWPALAPKATARQGAKTRSGTSPSAAKSASSPLVHTELRAWPPH